MHSGQNPGIADVKSKVGEEESIGDEEDWRGWGEIQESVVSQQPRKWRF